MQILQAFIAQSVTATLNSDNSHSHLFKVTDMRHRVNSGLTFDLSNLDPSSSPPSFVRYPSFSFRWPLTRIFHIHLQNFVDVISSGIAEDLGPEVLLAHLMQVVFEVSEYRSFRYRTVTFLPHVVAASEIESIAGITVIPKCFRPREIVTPCIAEYEPRWRFGALMVRKVFDFGVEEESVGLVFDCLVDCPGVGGDEGI